MGNDKNGAWSVTSIVNFTQSVPNFDSRTFISKIEIFGWYLHEIGGKPKFAVTDIAQCFEDTHCQQPSNIRNLLRQLCEKKTRPPFERCTGLSFGFIDSRKTRSKLG